MPNPILSKTEQPLCLECKHEFGISYLMTNFDHPVCDRCKCVINMYILGLKEIQ